MSFVYMRYDEIEDYINKKKEGDAEEFAKDPKEKKAIVTFEKLDEEEKKDKIEDINQDKKELDQKNGGEKTPFMEGNIINLEAGQEKTKKEEIGGEDFIF